MSIGDTASITCPQCGHIGQMGIWPTLNVSLDPEMKSKVLDQSLFRFTCSKCHHVANVFFRCLYHDMDSHTMVWLVEGGAETDEIQNVMTSLPFATSEYRLRIVRSINDLVEMAMMVDAGLNDLAVQVVKFGIMANDDAPEGPWYFNGVDSTQDEKMMVFSSPTSGVSCKLPLGDEFDELASSLEAHVRAKSWIEATPENVLNLLAETLEPRQ